MKAFKEKRVKRDMRYRESECMKEIKLERGREREREEKERKWRERGEGYLERYN